MQPINRILIGFIAFCATLGAALGVFLYISLLPHLSLIGWIVAALVVLGLGCTGTLMVSFTLHKTRLWHIRRNVVAVGEVVAVRNEDGTWTHLSAQHVAAGVPPPQPVTVKELPSGDPRWDAVLDLRKEGYGMQRIAKELKVPYNRVRTFLNQVEGNSSEI